MMSSNPLWREPAGAATESVSVRSIESLETPGPLRSLAFLALGPPLRLIRRLLHPGGLVRRTRRQMLQPRNLVPQRLVLDPQPRHGMAQLLVLPPQTRHFANQLANQVDQLGRRLPFKRIAGARTHPQLESHPFLTSPFRPGICPVSDPLGIFSF